MQFQEVGFLFRQKQQNDQERALQRLQAECSKLEADAQQLAVTHAEECEALRAEVARTAALVGADGDQVVSGLQAEIELKAAALEKLQAECSKLEADAVVLVEVNAAAAAREADFEALQCEV